MGLDTVELVMAFEETFGIEIPDKIAEEILTVQDVIDYVYSQVPHSEQPSKTRAGQGDFYRLQSDEGWTREEVRLTVRRLIVEHLGIPEGFSDSARIVDDLGAN